MHTTNGGRGPDQNCLFLLPFDPLSSKTCKNTKIGCQAHFLELINYFSMSDSPIAFGGWGGLWLKVVCPNYPVPSLIPRPASRGGEMSFGNPRFYPSRSAECPSHRLPDASLIHLISANRMDPPSAEYPTSTICRRGGIWDYMGNWRSGIYTISSFCNNNDISINV